MGTRRTPAPGTRHRHYIKEWRKFRGLTQQQLADRVDVAVSSISQLERYRQGYSQAMLEALADALACEPWDLLRNDPRKEGEVIDLTRMLDEADPVTKADALGYVKGLLRSNER